jgi:hypothetical protein
VTPRISVTFFDDYAAQTRTEESLTLPALAEIIRTTSAPVKGRLPWLKLARFGNACTPKGSLRHDRNIIAVSGIEADYDSEQIGFAEACEVLEKAGVEAIAYTSPSHTGERPRWRVLCPFSTELPSDRRHHMLGRLNGLFYGVFAPESWTLSQGYYFGAVDGNPAHRVAVIEGTPVDQLDELDELWLGKPGTSRAQKNGNGKFRNGPVDEEALLEEIRTGVSYHTAAIRLLGAWAAQGLSLLTARERIVTAFEIVFPPDRDDRWRARVAEIPRLLEYVWGKQARDAKEAEPPNDAPNIRVISGLRHRAADEGLAAMHTAGVAFYQRDRALVRVCAIKAKASDGTIVCVPGIVSVTLPVLTRALGKSARWERNNSKGAPIRIDPPKEVAEQIAGMLGEWPFPPLAGVIGTPTLRPDGSIFSTEGYDPKTGLVLMSPPTLPSIPDRPSKSDAIDALALLEQLLAEFPIADEPSRSVALSMMITPVVRGALHPAVPAHLTRAPGAGTGKSYLADVASAIAVGDRCAVIAQAPKKLDETEKRLIAAALAGLPIIALDNCSDPLQGDFLCQVTERPVLQLRPLGTSALMRVTNSFTTFANGNNAVVADDMVRRTLSCALDADMEHPEDRQFKANPVALVLADRGRYIAACLTVARAYIIAGQPGRLPSLPSFERWSDIVRSALVWFGRADPAVTIAAARAEDPSRQNTAAVFNAWATELTLGGTGYLTSELIEAAEERKTATGSWAQPTLRSALLTAARQRGSGEAQIDARLLGQWLRKATNNIAAGHKLTADRHDPYRPRWILIRHGR